MNNATAIRLFISLLLIVAIGAAFLGAPLIMFGAFVLIILIAIFSFGLLVKEDAKTLAKAKVNPYTKFPGSLFKEGVTGVILYSIIVLAIFFILNGILNTLLNKPLLDNWMYSISLTIIILAYEYYTYSNYKKLKKIK